MLRKIRQTPIQSRGGNFAIVASRYHARYVDAMVRAARAELHRAGVPPGGIQIVRVPGAYEIPVVAARLARSASRHPERAARLAAIICLGVILRGETVHAAHIGEAVSRALMDIQLAHEIPVIHEVLLLENGTQARARCLGRKFNRGAEAAQTAVAMFLEPLVEPRFHPDSFGYRPNKSAHDALAACRERCWNYDWAIDLDVQKFLESSSHCQRVHGGGVEQGCFGLWDQYSQAFSASVADVEGVQLAALDTLQHGLAGDTEDSHGVDDRHVAGRRVLDE